MSLTQAQFKQGLEYLGKVKNIHKVRGGYYTKDNLDVIYWHEHGSKRVVVLNDASGDAWHAIKRER